MIAKLLFICVLATFTTCDDITIENSIVFPQKKFDSLNAAWER